MTSNEEIDDLTHDPAMATLLSMVENINTRTIDISKEINKLKYLFDLKKSTQVTKTIKTMNEDEKKAYVTKQKMYLGKLIDGAIKTGKPETLSYYKIVAVNDTYKINED
jgi:hypothetical protein